MRRPLVISLPAVMLAVALALTHLVAQGPASGLRVITREGRRTLATVTQSGQEYVAIDDLAQLFGLTSREDQLTGGLTVTAGSRQIVVTANQSIASVSGRLISLSAPPVRQGPRWLVPLDFLNRALGPALDTRIEVRRASRLLVVGDLRVPRVTIRTDFTATSAAVTFETTPAASSRVSLDGGHLVVTFDADALDLTLPAVAPQAYLQALEASDTATTVRLSPGPRFGLYRSTSQAENGGSRLVITLLPPSTAGATTPPGPVPAPTPAPPAPTAPAPDDPTPLPMSTPPPGVRIVVIDPGHGGEEVGARGPRGTAEKDVTLAIARRLRTLIERSLGLRVFFTRDDDRLVTLDERSAYANSQKADLFVSLHANASLGPTMRGAEVSYLSLDRAEAAARQVALSSAVLPTLGGGSRTIDLIPWDTAQVGYLDQSATFAAMVDAALRERVAMSPRPLQAAPFRVLVGANMPAVLVEVGYLSHPDEEGALARASHQDLIAQALLDAITEYRTFVERVGQAAGPASQPR
ncbi:MAG: N-acetylmuramoyl-L-alanine amidase [Acidobacteriota bacterium]